MRRRLVLAGDSHLALLTGRLRWALTTGLPRWRVDNVAVGGSTVRDLARQLGGRRADALVLSLGTNDVAPDRLVPVEEFAATLADIRPALPARIVVVDPPGVVEGPAVTGRYNRTIDVYRALLIDGLAGPHTTVVGALGLVDTRTGAGLLPDGMHLDRRSNRRLIAAIVESLR